MENSYRPLHYQKTDPYYCWIMRQADPMPIIAGTGDKTSASLLSGIPIGFINQNASYSSPDSLTFTLPEGYVVSDLNMEIMGGTLLTVVSNVFYANYYFADIKAYAIS